MKPSRQSIASSIRRWLPIAALALAPAASPLASPAPPPAAAEPPAKGAAAAGPCRQALLLGLDVSGSIDDVEYRQQLDGLAAALTDPGVAGVILAIPAAPVALAVFEWAGRDHHVVLVDWTLLRSPDDLKAVAAALAARRRSPAPYTTGLGEALLFARTMMDRAPACRRMTLDISGDGRSNDGPQPQAVRDSGRLGGMTVNALAIGEAPAASRHARDSRAGLLAAYFRANVIHGPGAFVEQATGYAAYGRAMRRKLLRELTLELAGTDVPPSGR